MRFDTDEEGVPSGDLRGNLKGSLYDFWSDGRRLDEIHPNHSMAEGEARKLTQTFDEIFMISRSQPWKREDGPAAVLASDRSGITVELYTDQEALRVHTWDSKDGKRSFSAVVGPLQAWIGV